METLVKICKVHGEVSGEDVYKREYKNSNKKPTIHCRICHKKRCKEDYERRRILQGSRRNSSWVDGNMVCQKHGPLEEKDIGIHAQKQNVSGVQVRCKKCTSESNWRRDKYCKKHGVLADDKIKANGRCKLCHRESANRKRNNNRAWFNEKIKEDRLKNPEKWKEIYKRKYALEKKNLGEKGMREKTSRSIARMHGLSYEEYERMVSAQNDLCAICNEPETRASRTPGKTTRLVVDHCHKTNKVRGLLCHQCNLMLGYARDNTDILHVAAIYLEQNGEENAD